MKPMLWVPLAMGFVLAPNVSRCSKPDPHAGEVAWIDEAGELVVAPGYVLTTDGDCAALAPGSLLPPIPFDAAQGCFQKKMDPPPVPIKIQETHGTRLLQFQNGGDVLYFYDTHCRCHDGTERCPDVPPMPCTPL